MNSLQLRALAETESRRRVDEAPNTVVGIVHPDGSLIHALINDDGRWVETDITPDVYIAEKLERVLKSNKRFIIVIGGRGSSKSVGIADICLIGANDDNTKTYCLREYQSSIKNSVHSLLKSEIERLEFTGFDTQAQSILRGAEDVFQFAGIARNVDSIKSAHGFKRFYIEEAQFVSQDSLDVLTPTARNKPNKGLPQSKAELKDDNYEGVSMYFIANPSSREDPFSKRFIVPYEDELDDKGFYEDGLHLIVVMNYADNPWFDESGLESERKWAKYHLSSAMYEHIWQGDYNDSVENSLILGEWFDACIDAHKKLGWNITGANITAHDPSDTGGDTKGFARRHGSLVTHVTEKLDGDVNEGSRWAVGLAQQYGTDYYTWDCDGMGVALNEQVSRDFSERGTRIAMFKGSESPDYPDVIYKPAMQASMANQKTNKEVFRNKRVQYYCVLRDRIYRTFRCVVHGEFADPDKMISFDSSIESLRKLKSELCRLPVKPNANGLIDLYTKQEMLSKFKFRSPNLGDAVMMSMRYISINTETPYIPKRIGTMRLRGTRT